MVLLDVCGSLTLKHLRFDIHGKAPAINDQQGLSTAESLDGGGQWGRPVGGSFGGGFARSSTCALCTRHRPDVPDLAAVTRADRRGLVPSSTARAGAKQAILDVPRREQQEAVVGDTVNLGEIEFDGGRQIRVRAARRDLLRRRRRAREAAEDRGATRGISRRLRVRCDVDQRRGRPRPRSSEINLQGAEVIRIAETLVKRVSGSSERRDEEPRGEAGNGTEYSSVWRYAVLIGERVAALVVSQACSGETGTLKALGLVELPDRPRYLRQSRCFQGLVRWRDRHRVAAGCGAM